MLCNKSRNEFSHTLPKTFAQKVFANTLRLKGGGSLGHRESSYQWLTDCPEPVSMYTPREQERGNSSFYACVFSAFSQFYKILFGISHFNFELHDHCNISYYERWYEARQRKEREWLRVNYTGVKYKWRGKDKGLSYDWRSILKTGALEVNLHLVLDPDLKHISQNSRKVTEQYW